MCAVLWVSQCSRSSWRRSWGRPACPGRTSLPSFPSRISQGRWIRQNLHGEKRTRGEERIDSRVFQVMSVNYTPSYPSTHVRKNGSLGRYLNQLYFLFYFERLSPHVLCFACHFLSFPFFTAFTCLPAFHLFIGPCVSSYSASCKHEPEQRSRVMLCRGSLQGVDITLTS